VTAPLETFFGAMVGMLAGHRSASDIEQVLGRSPSGTDNLGFYAELVRRNLDKILRDVFGHVHALVLQSGDAATWRALARDYTRDHPPTGNVPNAFAAAFPQWLARRGAQTWSEIADFEWLRVRTHHAPDGDDDGFERRLFFRQYTFDVPGWIAAHARDASTPIPAASPCIAVVFRHHTTGLVGVHRPTPTGLAALARRAGAALPAELGQLDPLAILRAERALVAAGVLVPLAGEST
jgi:hypothetical protein